MMNWEELAAGWLRPLHHHLRRSLLTAGYLQVDETPVRYLAPGNGKTLTGYFWVYRSASGTLLYDWRPSRAHQCLDEVLTLHEHGRDTIRYQGILQTDGYAAYGTYQRLAAQRRQPIILAACWAHTRRKFHEAREQSPRLVGWILRQIGHLYTVEKNLRDQRAGPGLRQAIRAGRSAPIHQRLCKVFTKLSSRRSILPKSNLGMALRYAIELLPRLGVFLQDGRVELDTNLVENAIRPTAVGKKNWLFIGHEESGWKAAIFYTLIGNCRQLGIDPHAYLKDILEKLPTATNHTVAELLPANWAKQSHVRKSIGA